MYTYKDFITGKIRKTRGKFSGWTEPTGFLKVPYAMENIKKMVLCAKVSDRLNLTFCDEQDRPVF